MKAQFCTCVMELKWTLYNFSKQRIRKIQKQKTKKGDKTSGEITQHNTTVFIQELYDRLTVYHKYRMHSILMHYLQLELFGIYCRERGNNLVGLTQTDGSNSCKKFEQRTTIDMLGCCRQLIFGYADIESGVIQTVNSPIDSCG